MLGGVEGAGDRQRVGESEQEVAAGPLVGAVVEQFHRAQGMVQAVGLVADVLEDRGEHEVAAGEQDGRAVDRRPAIDVLGHPGGGGRLADPLQHVRLDQPGALLQAGRPDGGGLLLHHLGSLEPGPDIDGAVVLQLVELRGDRLFLARRHSGVAHSQQRPPGASRRYS